MGNVVSMMNPTTYDELSKVLRRYAISHKSEIVRSLNSSGASSFKSICKSQFNASGWKKHITDHGLPLNKLFTDFCKYVFDAINGDNQCRYLMMLYMELGENGEKIVNWEYNK